MRKNLSVISQDPKMASLTLHLMVIALLAAAAMTTVAATATAATRQRIRGVAPAVRGGGGVEGEGEATASTTSTEVPTLRAPRQRRPPTTQSIEIPLLSSRSRSRGLSRSSSSTTPIPTTPLPQAADKKQQQQQQQRRRFSTTTTTTPPTTVAPSARSLRDRGSVRGARQPRDTPALSSEFGGSSSSSRSWGQPQALPIPPGKASSLPTEHGHVAYSSSNFTSTSSVDSRSGGALKTPRMIHRLVAGHIQNAQGHSTYEVSAVSANSSHSASTSQPSTTTARSTATSRQPTALRGKGKASSSYRLAKPSPSPSPSPPYRDDNDDDEALLNEADDSFDNWDNGILRLSAGSGKEAEAEAEAPSKKPFKEDGKKTLADQVRDGKYGLIEKELFRRIPKRPGVLSYARNSEVPLDNERNYGGLNEQDIWLAEDHLLVIKGGSLNEDEGGGGGGQWPAIDDYDAPPRQIKLPANPAVPPPFPVQLEPHGPLQLIRDNQLEILHSAPGNATLSADASKQAPHQGYAPAAAHASHPAARAGAATAPKAAAPPYVYPAPYAPWLLYPNETTPGNGLLRSSPPLLGPWLINGLHANGSLAANAAVLPGNGSDFDEDDPSLYYPPAYSFVYKSNYSNLVPPGPLVPGIVLPPPPDHFSRLDTTTRRPPTSSSTTTSTSTTSTTTATAPTTTSKTTPRPATTPLPLRTSYKPKYNAISYLPPPPRQHQPQHQHQPHPAPKYVERVPVPVAVPIPIYPINYTPRPQAQLVFVSSSTEGKAQDADPPLSKSNPIYYEYFEAKRQPGSIKSNVIDDFLPTKPPKRHHLQHHLHYKASVSPANDVTDVVNITPKPRNAQLQLSAEYDAALGQLLRSNLISAAPAAAAATGAAVGSGRFHPPDFDKQPFLPMVNYSADEQDQNAFKAIVYQPPPSRQRQLRVGKQQLQQQQQQQQQQQHQQQQLQLDSTEDSYLPERQLRVGKQQQQQQQIYDSQIFSTPGPGPHYVEDQVHHLRPPAPVQTGTLQFWQRPPPQFKRVRQGSKHPHAHPHLHPYPPYFVPSYPSAPAGEPLYRLVPVAQHKHWRTKPQHPPQQSQQQSQPIQVHPQAQSYPDRAVNIGHSLAGDILVNYNTNNQFNSQAELVPQAQLAAPPLPPLSYQAQSGQGQGGPLWSEREKPGRQPRAQFTEQQQQQQQQ